MASGSNGDVTNALIFETLKAMQGTLARHTEDLREIKSRLGILEAQYASLSTRVDRLDERLARVEKRLGLVDTAI
ncbi:MAG: hypothetical protein JJ902_10285 [Roseibium sp.]|nr:hypothetical protein [Roseibium sp.]